jgi:hypothetical protein
MITTVIVIRDKIMIGIHNIIKIMSATTMSDMIETGLIIHLIIKRDTIRTPIGFKMIMIEMGKMMNICHAVLVGMIIEMMEDATIEK